MRKSAPGAVAILALSLFVAACGGGSSGAATGFAEEANAACVAANRRVAALGRPEGQAALVRYFESTEATVGKLSGEIAALGGPDGAYLAGLEKSASVLNEMANAARSRNLDGVGELSDGLVEIHLGRLARAAGLEACAEVPTAGR